MKKIYIIVSILVMLILFTRPVLLGQWVQVVVDPGHGGPDASKYGPNGDGAGTDGPLPSGQKLSEEWVNLQVAFVLKDSIDWYCMHPGYALMTRIAETEGVELAERARRANLANCDFSPEFCGSEEFISVHHNGLPLDSQGVETFWCNYDSVWIEGIKYDRDQTDVLARKIYYKLRDSLSYPPYTPRGYKINCFQVLSSTTMASTLSEGTNMHNDSEAILFDDPNLQHVKKEANEIFRGWRSYYKNNGIVTVANRGLCDFGGNVTVDGIERQSPYYTCWSFGELTFHNLIAYEYHFYDSYFYVFHHWKEVETGYINWDRTFSFFVNPSESTHTYIAYYTGGPYSISLEFPIVDNVAWETHYISTGMVYILQRG
jgi:N-acetylmuramoyl-L-alanine amidase